MSAYNCVSCVRRAMCWNHNKGADQVRLLFLLYIIFECYIYGFVCPVFYKTPRSLYQEPFKSHNMKKILGAKFHFIYGILLKIWNIYIYG